MERKLKLYQRLDNTDRRHVLAERVQPLTVPHEAVPVPIVARPEKVGKMRLRELTEQSLLNEITPPSALVNEQGDILYLHGRTGMYLEPAPGESGVSNILKMAREGLQNVLAVALHRAVSKKEVVNCPSLRVKTNGDFTLVDVTVRPVAQEAAATAEATLYLVTMQNAPLVHSEKPRPKKGSRGTPVDTQDTQASGLDVQVAELKRELQAKEAYLQIANEELETSNEELKSSNEEMQSVNEELQSTNEELETSKEELQSLNEELSTVNAELQTKIVGLSQANDDMNNLLAGTGIGTVFVDHQLRILRFTPAITQIINLISTDVGRPVGHIVSNLVGYDQLVPDTKAVLDTLVPKELEVNTRAGGWYRLHIRSYRTLNNVIEGAVITFVDITDVKKALDLQREGEKNFRSLAKYSRDAILIADNENVVFVNQACLKMFGARNDFHLLGKSIRALFYPDSYAQMKKSTQSGHDTNESMVPTIEKILRVDGTVLDVEVVGVPLPQNDSQSAQYIMRQINEVVVK
jgi:two-component system CheB/CheR fusion protein